MQNIKYFRFFFILCLIGLCFWQREKIEEGIRRIWPAAETESLRETEESGEADEGGNEQEETPALSPEETESPPSLKKRRFTGNIPRWRKIILMTRFLSAIPALWD